MALLATFSWVACAPLTPSNPSGGTGGSGTTGGDAPVVLEFTPNSVTYTVDGTSSNICSNGNLTCTQECPPPPGGCGCYCAAEICGEPLDWGNTFTLSDYQTSCGATGIQLGQHVLTLTYHPASCYPGIPWEPQGLPVITGVGSGPAPTGGFWTASGGYPPYPLIGYDGTVSVNSLDEHSASFTYNIQVTTSLDENYNVNGPTATISGSSMGTPCPIN